MFFYFFYLSQWAEKKTLKAQEGPLYNNPMLVAELLCSDRSMPTPTPRQNTTVSRPFVGHAPSTEAGLTALHTARMSDGFYWTDQCRPILRMCVRPLTYTVYFAVSQYWSYLIRLWNKGKNVVTISSFLSMNMIVISVDQPQYKKTSCYR